MRTTIGTLLVLVGLAVGYIAARLDNAGRHRTANVLLGLFVLSLLTYIMVGFAGLWE